MRKITLFLSVWLLVGCAANPRHDWRAEDASGMASLVVRGDTLEITAPAGLTLWHEQPLRGDYRIGYTARIIMAGGPHDRLADLNCFWAAEDPAHPTDFFARSAWRGGVFHNYNSLNLFYVGYGGNHNTTTRFRRYHGERFPASDSEVKPLLGEYTTPEHLLSPNSDYRIEITVRNGVTTYAVNAQTLFSYDLAPGEGDGYFGLRLLTNHTLIYGLKIEKL